MTATKTLIKVTFEFGRPWAVGAVSGRDDVDLPIMLDPRRDDGYRPYLPATSLVGPLRVHLGDRLAEDWLGPEPKRAGDPGADQRIASRLWALGTRLSDDQLLEQFTTTRIDGERAAAFKGSSRSQQRVAVSASEQQPSTLDWFLMADETVPDDIIEKLRGWRVFVGRGRGTGHGLARVSTVTIVTLDLTDQVHLTWWLTARHQWMAGSGDHRPPLAEERSGTSTWPAAHQVTYDWRIIEPVAVGTDQPDEVRETPGRPMTKPRPIRRRGDKVPIVPGSSWRGVFRHRSELILTAVGLSCADRCEIVEHLFGQASHSASGEQRGRRGRLRFLDSAFSGPSDAETLPDAESLERTHVAIDRISGGAARGLLFQVTAVRPGAACTLTIETDDELERPYANLLHHVARDIHDGLVGVGGLVTRGYGTLEQVSRRPVTPIDADDLRARAQALRAARRTRQEEST